MLLRSGLRFPGFALSLTLSCDRCGWWNLFLLRACRVSDTLCHSMDSRQTERVTHHNTLLFLLFLLVVCWVGRSLLVGLLLCLPSNVEPRTMTPTFVVGAFLFCGMESFRDSLTRLKDDNVARPMNSDERSNNKDLWKTRPLHL